MVTVVATVLIVPFVVKTSKTKKSTKLSGGAAEVAKTTVGVLPSHEKPYVSGGVVLVSVVESSGTDGTKK